MEDTTSAQDAVGAIQTQGITPEQTPVAPSVATTPSPRKTINTAEKIVASNDPLKYIEKAGIDLVELYKELDRIATKAMVFAKDRDGFAVELGEDNKARIAAIALLLELAKHIKDKSAVLSVGIFNDPNVVREAERVLKLKERMGGGGL